MLRFCVVAERSSAGLRAACVTTARLHAQQLNSSCATSTMSASSPTGVHGRMQLPSLPTAAVRMWLSSVPGGGKDEGKSGGTGDGTTHAAASVGDASQDESATTTTTTATTTTTPAAQPIAARLKEVIKLYGITATVLHSTVYVWTLGTVYIAVRSGLDTVSLLQSWGLGEQLLTAMPKGAGDLAAAWCVTAVTGPARGIVTITAAPLVANWIKKRRAAGASN